MNIINFDTNTPGWSKYVAMVASLEPKGELAALLAAPGFTLDLDTMPHSTMFNAEALVADVKRTWRESGCPQDEWPLRPKNLGEPEKQDRRGDMVHGLSACEPLRYQGGDALHRLAELAVEKGQAFELTIEKLTVRIAGSLSSTTTPHP